jgi:hypothetical protein
MFEMYARNINPDEERFNIFISNYLAERGVKDPQAIPYSELYKVIKDGIREYLKQQQPTTRSKK